VFLGLPAFNEAEAIAPLFERIRLSRERVVADHLASDLEVIFYNDGSTDETVDHVRRNCVDLQILLITPKQNGGLGRALEGIVNEFLNLASSQDVLVIMDSDDTHDPIQIVELLNSMDEKDQDVVIASRYQRGSKILGVPPIRQVLSLGFAFLVKVIFPIKGVRDYSCGYRAYTYEALKALSIANKIQLQEAGFASMPEILIRLREKDLRFGEIPLELAYDRRLTQSKMRAWQNSIRLLQCLITWRFSRLEENPLSLTEQSFSVSDTTIESIPRQAQ
jgi:dolichol-phosphate mannosyltransferase